MNSNRKENQITDVIWDRMIKNLLKENKIRHKPEDVGKPPWIYMDKVVENAIERGCVYPYRFIKDGRNIYLIFISTKLDIHNLVDILTQTFEGESYLAYAYPEFAHFLEYAAKLTASTWREQMQCMQKKEEKET